MNLNGIGKKTIFIIVILILCLLLLLGFSITGGNSTVTKQNLIPTPTPVLIVNNGNSIQPQQLTSYSPDKSIPLIPYQVQPYSVSFGRQIDVPSLLISLTKTAFTSNTIPSIVPVLVSASQDNKTVIIKPVEATQPASKYKLSILTKSGKQTVFTVTYLSDDAQPTRIPTNNPQLMQYVPHETQSYKLSYLPERNLYICNFKFDTANPADIETQFNAAKKDALQYIQINGIDPQTIAIEWRSS